MRKVLVNVKESDRWICFFIGELGSIGVNFWQGELTDSDISVNESLTKFVTNRIVLDEANLISNTKRVDDLIWSWIQLNNIQSKMRNWVLSEDDDRYEKWSCKLEFNGEVVDIPCNPDMYDAIERLLNELNNCDY